MVAFPRPVELVNKSIGTAGLTIARNIAYGPGPRDRLDIYRPTGAAALPIIVFFYGGSWQWGHRADYQFIAAVLAKKGFVVAVPDYRLYPEVKFPAFLNDCAAATAFMLKNASAHGGDPGHLFLAGHSAGAYNAVSLALNGAFLQAHGSSPDLLAGVIGLCGPYDFLPIRDPVIKDIFSPPSDIRLTQPITFAREGTPPMFLAHGGADLTVLPRNTTALAARLRQAGSVVETRIYPKLGHIGLLLSHLPYLSWRAPVLKDSLSFIAGCRAGDHNATRSELSAPVQGR
jgi:acetyl esterase/lipase